MLSLFTKTSRLRAGSSRLASRVLSSSTTSQKSSSAGKAIVGSVLTVTGIVGGSVGYAGYDSEFRRQVEQAIPGAKDVLNTILGPEKAAVPTPPSKLKVTPVKAIKTVEPLKKPAIGPPAPDQLPAPKPEPELALPPPPLEVFTPQTGEADNLALEKRLSKACVSLERSCDAAVRSGEHLVQATKIHTNLVQKVLEVDNFAHPGESDEKTWQQVFEAAAAKMSAAKQVESAMDEVKTNITMTQQIIQAGENSESTQKNPALKLSDNRVSKVLRKLDQVKAEIEAGQKEAVLVDRLREMVEAGRQHFQKEVAALLPQQDGGGNLSEEELNVFLMHAYKRVSQLELELARMKSVQQERMDEKRNHELATEELIQSELNAQRRELKIEYQRQIAALRDDMEKEMRSQLRRQVSAHSDHLQEALDVQKKQLDRIKLREVDEAVSSEKSAYSEEMSKIMGRVQAMDAAVKQRAQQQTATRDAQNLWLTCVALQTALKNENANQVNLDKEVEHLKISFQANDPFVKQALHTIPKEAVSGGGIYTEKAIKDRFFRVEQVAGRTALIGDEGGSLLTYLLSYLQSLFIVRPSTVEMPAKDIPIDVDSLSPFDLIWLARGSLEHGDLEQAVKYMSLLRGEPRNVCKDWLKEARLLLKTQLACDALLAHAAAIGVQAFPPH